MLRVGLTGGIGAGKSTVAAELASLGAVVVDSDKIAREVVEPGTEGLAAVVEAFGDDVLDGEGRLDRPALGRIVFADDEARGRLNGILHPRIGARTGELVAAAPTDAVLVHDVPLLVENGMGAAFALVVVVDAPEDVRVERLGRTRDMAEDDARSRIRAQATTEARRAAADVWIDNVGSQDEVRAGVRSLWHDRLVPFEAAVRAGSTTPWPDEVVDPDPTWPDQARRLAARLTLAGGAGVDRVEHVGPTAVPGLPAPDVVDLLVLTTDGAAGVREALAGVGFPSLEDGRLAGADPTRPVRVVLDEPDLLAARDAARADPDRIAREPAAVRSDVAPA
ncbi:dephospho-CoA kinase [Actinomycetospora termitidis]|uniref:Dephospho-CoA kinase n=1 Tax=Actinomycetospora termitidis TaxID=3053470 RepID=A0ABT7MET5_9PSEU|nr:dephospho-CoA kinase [Actinomycetospora sp. Odt1-22]MDL5158402.1 dephospho-CoA kinase [Actinomycetospora sp. Odt1-22]